MVDRGGRAVERSPRRSGPRARPTSIQRSAPARLFDSLVAVPGRGGSVVVFTTVGWKTGRPRHGRVPDIGTGTAAVRVSMTAVPGLRIAAELFLPGVIALDPPTLTFYDEASMVAWAHDRRPTSARWTATHDGNAIQPRSRDSPLLSSDVVWRGPASPGAVRARYAGRQRPVVLRRRPPDALCHRQWRPRTDSNRRRAP